MVMSPLRWTFFAAMMACADPLGENDPPAGVDASTTDASDAENEADTPVPDAGPCALTPAITSLFLARCGPGCHMSGASLGGIALDAPGLATARWVVPGSPEESEIWGQVKSGQMPPGGGLTDGEKDAVLEWVAALDCTPEEAGLDDVTPLGFTKRCIRLPKAPCNPLTNAGCDASRGEACDLDLGGTALVCYPAPNLVASGGACDLDAGPFCAPGLRCDDGVCAAYCCTDADCGGGLCAPIDTDSGTLGVCRAR